MDNFKIVKAAPGTQCPHEHFPREYIGDSIPVRVPMTSFYRRRIADGSLVDVETIHELPPQVKTIDNKKGVKK